MINIALLGAGRIGKMHAEIINAHPKARLQFVYDVNSDSAKQVSEEKIKCYRARKKKSLA